MARQRAIADIGVPRAWGARNPAWYVRSVAMNAARDRMRGSHARYLIASEVASLLDVPDTAPDPGRIAEARSEVERRAQSLRELPERERRILLAARIEGAPRRETARRFGISLRLVERELQHAQEYCLARQSEPTVGPKSPE